MEKTQSTQYRSTPPDMDHAFVHSIRNIGIPPCPSIVLLVINETKKDEPNYNHLTSVINADVALSAGLIKLANSAFFGSRLRVRSVREALTVLGLNSASRAIAGIVLRNLFPHSPIMERFWDASARIARLSGWLARQLNIPGITAEDAYTFGLFRDCGIPILLNHLPGYADILVVANTESVLSFTQIEEASIHTNHAFIGSKLAEDWRLPAEIFLSIRNHHELEILKFDETRLPHILLCSRLIAISQIAEHIVQRQLGLSLTHEWAKLGIACLQLLDINDEKLNQIYEAAQPIAAEVIE